ncbi:putative reverse transcriptase (RNA-dependent DNA polymerase) [Lyophyllum shimeji]|uniref:Reverse transcriptase (RNA-dependent DNA polymerase) n=1 Tax=Lyophyllum shimeji TaxID=47721 RepID=A0A9P3UX75_LYOSH|nr:putative reverse transcriptase (RNA-dependent DNA polymerase) [Lyophyllum shimeji]
MFSVCFKDAIQAKGFWGTLTARLDVLQPPHHLRPPRSPQSPNGTRMNSQPSPSLRMSPTPPVTTMIHPAQKVYDSGCTRHISPYRDDFENFIEIFPKAFCAANKQRFMAVGKGEMEVDVPNGVDVSQLELMEVLYSPEVGYTLVSIDGEVVGEIPKSVKGMCKVDHEQETANAAVKTLTLNQFHRRMGHISPAVTRHLVKEGFVTGVRLESTPAGDFFCESCIYTKATRKPVSKVRVSERTKEFGDEIDSNLWGPARVATKQGRRYYNTFTDNKTRLTHLHLLRNKSDAFDAYKQHEARCETQMKPKIKVPHSDRGGEYLGKEFTLYLKSKGTEQKLTVHDTPQHNSVVECRNRIIVERIRALLHFSSLPKSMWGEAARHVVWLLNRTSTKAIEGMTPYEAAFGEKPNLRTVLGWVVKEGRWLGLDERSKGFDETSASNGRLKGEDWELIYATIDTPPPAQNTKANPVHTTSTPAPAPTAPTPAPKVPPAANDEVRAKRVQKPSERVKDLLEGRGVTLARPSDPNITRVVEEPTRVLEGEGEADWMMAADFAEEYAMAAEIGDAEALEPRSLAEAKRCPDWPLWEKAIQEELATLRDAGTWEVTEAPAGANIVGSKWVFRAKKDAVGNVVRYKALLVAQTFSQVPGVDYFDTFAPVAKLASIRAVLALAAAEDMEMHQIDIKGAYLNGELTSRETIFMQQPGGYHAPNSSGRVCHLRKTLYGLKQSGRRWYQKLVDIMGLLVVLVHADDCTIVGASIDLITDFKARLAEHVEITDLGELHWLLGIEIKRDLKPTSIPMDTNFRLSYAQSPATTAKFAAMRDVPYHEAVGSLISMLRLPGPAHWEAVKKIFRYLKGTMELWLSYKRSGRALTGYADADADANGSMAEDRHAISGYAFIVNGGAVSWSAKRQEITVLSTTEAKYVAATHAAKEALWLRSLHQEKTTCLYNST